MACVITYTSSTEREDFYAEGAQAKLLDFGGGVQLDDFFDADGKASGRPSRSRTAPAMPFAFASPAGPCVEDSRRQGGCHRSDSPPARPRAALARRCGMTSSPTSAIRSHDMPIIHFPGATRVRSRRTGADG